MLLGCTYCKDAGPDPGWLWMDNNGPIVRCPFCNPEPDDFTKAEQQRDAEQHLKRIQSKR